MPESTFTIDTALAFDVGKQAAILGWCLRDKLFCMQCSRTVKAEWFSSPNVGKLYAGLMAMFGEYSRVPKPLELKNYRPFTLEDARAQERLRDALQDALKQTQTYGLDVLRDEMTAWMHAIIFQQSIQKAALTYNAKKVEEAWQIVETATFMKTTATFEDGISQGFLRADERIAVERAERVAQAPKVLNYGVGFLDDSLGGIIPNDLIVIGAKTGAGKTQLATSVALETSQRAANYEVDKAGKYVRDAEDNLVVLTDKNGIPVTGAPVHYFALEAEDNEIERRIKYGKLSDMYYRLLDGDMPLPEGLKRPADRRVISYTDWRMGKLDKLLRAYEEYLEPELKSAVKNLHTLYRTSGNFNLQALERGLLQVVTETRLIVIDHLHYVDVDDSDENKGYKRVIKLVRDIVLHYNVPIIVIAHLRKTQGGARYAPLISTIEDFHGTSDVPKIATTCIMMAPAYDRMAPHKWQWPTYIGAVKSRLDGSRTRFTGLVNYDARTSRYDEAYRIGKMTDMGKEWEELMGNAKPAWADAAEEGDPIKPPALE